MGSPQRPLAALYLLGMLVTSCLGVNRWEDADQQVKLSGSNSRCQGQVEVDCKGQQCTVSIQSWGLSRDRNQNRWQELPEATKLCKKLGCGDALALGHFPKFQAHGHSNGPQNEFFCLGQVGTLVNCSRRTQGLPLGLICLEPKATTHPPTRPPPTTTPEPTASPRLQLVAGPWGLHCAGMVQLHKDRREGLVASDGTKGLENLICEAVQCGSFLWHLPEAEAAGVRHPGESQPLSTLWKIKSANCSLEKPVEECFQSVQPWEDSQPLALLCSGFGPKVQSRLVGGGSQCAGSVQVRQHKQWEDLCHNPLLKGAARWEQLCQEHQCGKLTSYQVLATSEKTSQGLTCPQEKLSQCHQLQEKKSYCKRVFVTCEDPNPPGLGTGSVMSILLALVLLAVLLVVCGPPAYKKLAKKFHQKKQRQWIGPTEMSQNMSFHRNHTATVRMQVENPPASHVENDYSQPPRNSCALAYPALEGALHRASTQLDNSSDSDYDLHAAQRL